MKKQLIWVFEWRKSVHYWWTYILFSPECKELTSMLDPLLYRWGVPPVVIRCVHCTMQMGVLQTWIKAQGIAIVMERNRLLSHSQLSWSFVDELGLELASRHPWLLTFLKSPKCVFSDGSTYNSWKAAAGITAAGCHELVTAPLEMSLTHISESADLISFDDELPVSTPRAEGVVSDVFVDDSPLNRL